MSQDTVTIAETLEVQMQGARLRVLISGAGIAGATLAALMRRRGAAAAVIERHGPTGANGYMLGLLPLGCRVMNGLGLRDALIERSLDIDLYDLYDRKGRPIQSYPLKQLTDRYGLDRGVERGALLDLLRGVAGPVRHDSHITAIAQDDRAAHVTFDDGSSADFDLVVIAEGIHSKSRDMVLRPGEVVPNDTGWGGHVVWTKTPLDAAAYHEMWAPGWGIGIYPVPGRAGLFLAGRAEEVKPLAAFDYAERLLARGLTEPFAGALEQIDRDAEAIYWPMADIRSKVWSRGRVVLLGDSAAAFLPTAGVGASMAMDSAAALADELSRAEPGHIPYALSLYERRQRPRVELAQKNSRQLAKLMFMNSAPLTALRDPFMRFYSVERMIADLSRVMEGR